MLTLRFGLGGATGGKHPHRLAACGCRACRRAPARALRSSTSCGRAVLQRRPKRRNAVLPPLCRRPRCHPSFEAVQSRRRGAHAVPTYRRRQAAPLLLTVPHARWVRRARLRGVMRVPRVIRSRSPCRASATRARGVEGLAGRLHPGACARRPSAASSPWPAPRRRRLPGC